MPPPKQACETILNTKLAIIEIVKRIRETRQTVRDSIDLKLKLKYGLITLLDTVGAETLTAIRSVSASAARSILGSVSGIASNLMEAIISSILKILLAHPTAVFSLIAIPHSQAVQAVYDERRLLRQANRNLRTILRIVLKWSKGFGGTRFYNQMVEALPYIQTAIELSVSLLKELEGYSEGGDVRNARLNEGKLRFMQRQINTAIEITTPTSVINEQLQITKSVEKSKELYYQEQARKINADYDSQRRSLHASYTDDLVRINQQEDGLARATWLEAARTEYTMKRKVIETERKVELQEAEIEAAAKAAVDKNAYARAAAGLVGAFVDDMNTLGANLKELVENVGGAFRAYKRSQALCHSMYRIRALITNLINQMIEILRNTGNASAEVAINGIQNAQAYLLLTEEEFTDDISRFESTSERISSTELSSDVVLGHNLLNTADAFIKGSITDSLIDLINSDDVLQIANERFEKFYQELEQISDWDGATTNGVSLWATNPTSAAISPYPQLIADATSILAKVPVLALSSNEEDQLEITAVMRETRKSFINLFRHNSEVRSVLTSYQPYMSSEGGNLLRILSNAGLVTNFATTLSVAALAADVVVATGGNPFEDTIPTYGNCRRHYPELYASVDAAGAAAFDRYNLPGQTIDMAFQKTAEETESDRITTEEYVRNTDINAVLNNDDFPQPSKTG